MAKRKETAFEKESKGMEVVKAGPSAAMVALFQKPAEEGKFDLRKLKARNLPPMIKPADVPVGQMIIGEVLDAVSSPKASIKGKLLILKPYRINGDTVEAIPGAGDISFPATGSVRTALVPGSKDEDGEQVIKGLREHLGSIVFIMREANQENKEYKKEMYIFRVWTIDKGAKLK